MGRLYAYGTSNGGAMCQRIAVNGGMGFTGVAPSATQLLSKPAQGGPGPYNHNWPSAAACTVPIAYVSFHGYKDPLIPYDGGKAPPGGDPTKILLSSMEETNAAWSKNNGCGQTPTIVSLPATVKTGPTTADHYTWPSCVASAPTEHYKVIDGTHSTVQTIEGRSAVVVMMDFFAKVEKTCLSSACPSQNASLPASCKSTTSTSAHTAKPTTLPTSTPTLAPAFKSTSAPTPGPTSVATLAPTTTVAGGSGSQAAPAKKVSTQLTVDYLDFDEVNSNATAKAALISDIKAAFLAQHSDYVAADIQVALARGSVKATVSVTPKAGSDTASLKISIASTKDAIAAAVLMAVKTMASLNPRLLESGKSVDHLIVTASNPVEVDPLTTAAPTVSGVQRRSRARSGILLLASMLFVCMM